MPTEDEAAAGVAIEPVGKARRMRQAEAQRIEPAFESRSTAGTGMHRNPRRLVDHQYEPVAIEDAVVEVAPHRPAPSRRTRACACRVAHLGCARVPPSPRLARRGPGGGAR